MRAHSGGFVFKYKSKTVRLTSAIALPRRFGSGVMFSGFQLLCRGMVPNRGNSPLGGRVSSAQRVVLGCSRGVFSLSISSVGCSGPSGVICS